MFLWPIDEPVRLPMDYWSVVLENFDELLDHRLTNASVTTEDAVRYTMFHCLTKFANVHPSDIVPEFPHPTIYGAEIDTGGWVNRCVNVSGGVFPLLG